MILISTFRNCLVKQCLVQGNTTSEVPAKLSENLFFLLVVVVFVFFFLVYLFFKTFGFNCALREWWWIAGKSSEVFTYMRMWMWQILQL